MRLAACGSKARRLIWFGGLCLTVAAVAAVFAVVFRPVAHTDDSARGPGASPGGGAAVPPAPAHRRLRLRPGRSRARCRTCRCRCRGCRRWRSGEHLRRRRAGHAQPGGTRGAVPDLRAEQRRFHRDRHRPVHLPGDRELPDRAQPAARGARLRPAHAVRDQRPGQQPHPDQPPHRPAGRSEHPCGRPVQHVLHPGRALRDRGGRGPPAPGLPRPAHLRARTPDPGRTARAWTTSTSRPTAPT